MDSLQKSHGLRALSAIPEFKHPFKFAANGGNCRSLQEHKTLKPAEFNNWEPERPHKHNVKGPKTLGIPETVLCGILVLMWSFGPPTMTPRKGWELRPATDLEVLFSEKEAVEECSLRLTPLLAMKEGLRDGNTSTETLQLLYLEAWRCGREACAESHTKYLHLFQIFAPLGRLAAGCCRHNYATIPATQSRLNSPLTHMHPKRTRIFWQHNSTSFPSSGSPGVRVRLGVPHVELHAPKNRVRPQSYAVGTPYCLVL